MEQLKVSTRSNPNSVAGAMATAFTAWLSAPAPTTCTSTAPWERTTPAIARGYVAASGIDLVCVPTFADITINGERRTAIRLRIEDRAHVGPVEEVLTIEDPVVMLER